MTLFWIYLLFLPYGKGKTWEIPLIPGSMMGGIQDSYSYSFIIAFSDLAFVGLLFLVLKDELKTRWLTKSLFFNKADYFLFGFLFFCFLSVFFSNSIEVSYLSFLKLARVVGTFFMMRLLLKDERAKKLTLLGLATVLIFQGFWSSLQFLFQHPLGRSLEPYGLAFSDYGYMAREENTFFRVHGTWDHPNTLGAFMISLLSFLWVQLFNPKQAYLTKYLFYASLVFGVLGLIFSASRASWVLASFLFIVMWYFLSRYFKFKFPLKLKWIVSSVLIFLIFIPIVILPRLEHFSKTFEEGGGVYYRMELIDKAIIVSQESPLGVGLANFPYTLINSFGFYTWPAPVHNLIFEILSETGIISLTFFLVFLLLSYKEYFKQLKHQKNFDFFLKTGAFFASLGFLLISQFYPFFVNSRLFEFFWLFLGIMLY